MSEPVCWKAGNTGNTPSPGRTFLKAHNHSWCRPQLWGAHANTFPAEMQYHHVHWTVPSRMCCSWMLSLSEEQHLIFVKHIPRSHREELVGEGKSHLHALQELVFPSKQSMIFFLDPLYPSLPQHNYTLCTAAPVCLLTKCVKRREPTTCLLCLLFPNRSGFPKHPF